MAENKKNPSMTCEGKAKFCAYQSKTVSKQLPVFYNPAMELNRDITILLLNSVPDKKLNICDLMAGTGVRTLRLLLELDKSKIAKITSNDSNKKFPSLLKKNLALNKLSKLNKKMLSIKNQDASSLLLASTGFSYIDIDPFGTPNLFLDPAVKRLARDGILAVTATDTSALCGAFPDACKRKYWASPRHDYLMHEAGLRILIRKVQLVASQFEKALVPIYCYSHEYHMRVFFRVTKQKSAVDEILKQHDFWDNFGPLWTGLLWDARIAKKVACLAKEYPKTAMMADLISQEAEVKVMGFIEVHGIGKRLGIGDLPKTEELAKAIRKQGFLASRTHFSGSGIRTDMPLEQIEELIKK